MIVITGAAGFIGSCLVSKLNEEGYYDLVLVDDFSKPAKNKNFEGKRYAQCIDRKYFIKWLRENQLLVQFVFHLGARTDTTESDKNLLDLLNLEFSKNVWKVSVEFGLPLVYASSAATYGLGEQGYSDSHETVERLNPLNLYGESKNEFDKWALRQERKPYFWAGIKFFNVYGPNEYHKGRMASVIFHAFRQIGETGSMKLFRSHHPDFRDGEQKRDFIYVKDVVDVLFFFMLHRKNSGIYNLGSGEARTFLDLVRAVFGSMNKPENIQFIDTPEDIRDKYQYFTEAEMNKLRLAGYEKPFHSLEEGVQDYVLNYLQKERIY